MFNLLKNFILLFFIIVFSFNNSYSRNTYALFSPHEGAKAFNKINDLISKSQSFVYITIYSWTDKSIDKALITAAKNGADVRVVLHKPLSRKPRIIKKVIELEKHGIQVKSANKNMHEKFIVIDNKYLINSSANFSGGAKYRYSENFIFHENKSFEMGKLFSSFVHEFSILWNSHIDDFIYNNFIADEITKYLNYSIDLPIINLPTESLVGLYSSSTNFLVKSQSKGDKGFSLGKTIKLIRNGGKKNQTWHIRDRLIQAINNSKTSIYLAVNHFNIKLISDALIEAVKRGVDVRLAVDNQEFKVRPNNKEMTPQFVQDWKHLDETKGLEIPVRVKFYSLAPSPRHWFLNHHKFILIDYNEAGLDTILLSGSYNLSKTAEHNQFDNLVVYKGEKFSNLFTSFKVEFDNLWFLNRNDLDVPNIKILNRLFTPIKGQISLHSKEPVSLKWHEVINLRNRIQKKSKGIFPISYKKRDCLGFRISTHSFTGCPKKR